MSPFAQKYVFYSSQSPSEIHTKIRDHTALIEDFKIVSKLSAGGIVVRTLQAPKSEKPFFGKIEDDWQQKIELAELRYTRNLTPYQPIMYIELKENDQGTDIAIRCDKHPDMFELGFLYNLAGILLMLGTIPIYSVRPEISLLSAFFGVILLIYPRLRAKISYEEATESAMSSFQNLPLEIKDKPEIQGTIQAPSQ